MKKNNWPKRLVIVPTILIAILLVIVFTNSSVMQENNNNKPILSESIDNESSASKNNKTTDIKIDSAEISKNCITFIEYLDSPSYYAYDKWQRDLGIPTVNYSTSGLPILEDHPFSAYTTEDLEVKEQRKPNCRLCSWPKNYLGVFHR